MKRNIFVGGAWPYANGSLHLGHTAALLGADILARYHRLAGDEVLFVSGSDCHGTPIAVEADKQRVHPSAIAEKYHQEFIATLIDGLGFSYDLYTKTTTENHREVVQDLFLKLHQKGFIYTKTEALPFCLFCQRFLPDRYVEGRCPFCNFAGARGDQCDECGNLLDPRQLLEPRCKICAGRPEWRASEHFFLRLSAWRGELQKWVAKSQGWRANAQNFTLKLLEQDLPDRAITRDTDWGVPIPLPGYQDKRIYVWFEAVSGYLSASKEWAKLQGQPALWEKFWLNDDAVSYYVHGKDNIPFHTIIWPAILMGQGGLHLPDRIVSSEYLTLEGKQFSKSRHWAVWLPDFLAHFAPETLRYYLTINGPESADADFSWRQYQVKVNHELIGSLANFVHRVLSLAQTNFSEGLAWPEKPTEKGRRFLGLAEEAFQAVGQAIEEGRFREGFKSILQLAEEGNRYLEMASPWSKIQSDKPGVASDLAVAGQAIRALAILINPYLPRTSERLAAMVGPGLELKWHYPAPKFLQVSGPQPLFKKIEDEEVAAATARLGQDSETP